jgi:enoyl-CoA hydratase/carnithine racemase
MMPNRRLCKLSSCGIVLPRSNGCSRTLTVSRLWRLPRSHPEVHHSGWAGLSSESGLTEAQEDLVEHLELIYTGKLLNGTEATEWDLVNRGVPEDESLDETLAVARRVAAGPIQAFRLSKRITHRITDAALSFDAVFATEADAQGEATRTADYTEGITAFQTKREPSFTGRPASVRSQ